MKIAGLVKLLFNNIDFKQQLIKRDREGYNILIKGKIYQDDISFLPIYAPNTRVTKCVKETLNHILTLTHGQ